MTSQFDLYLVRMSDGFSQTETTLPSDSLNLNIVLNKCCLIKTTYLKYFNIVIKKGCLLRKLNFYPKAGENGWWGGEVRGTWCI